MTSSRLPFAVHSVVWTKRQRLCDRVAEWLFQCASKVPAAATCLFLEDERRCPASAYYSCSEPEQTKKLYGKTAVKTPVAGVPACSLCLLHFLPHVLTPGPGCRPPVHLKSKSCSRSEQNKHKQGGTGQTCNPTHCRAAPRTHVPHFARLKLVCASLGGLTPPVLLLCTSASMTSCSLIRVACTHAARASNWLQCLFAGDVWCAGKRCCALVLTAVLRGSDCL